MNRMFPARAAGAGSAGIITRTKHGWTDEWMGLRAIWPRTDRLTEERGKKRSQGKGGRHSAVAAAAVAIVIGIIMIIISQREQQ